jgi:hypothetical protein
VGTMIAALARERNPSLTAILQTLASSLSLNALPCNGNDR